MQQKLVPDPFLICMQEVIFKIRYFEGELSKSLKKVDFTFFFRTQSFLMDKIMKNKRILELVTRHSPGYKKSSENSSLSDVLPDQV